MNRLKPIRMKLFCRMSNYKILVIAGVLCTLSGCRVMHTPAPIRPMALPQSYTGQTDSVNIGQWPYHTLFADAKLVALIDTALLRNPDLNMAIQRMEIARATVNQTRGALVPQVNLGATAAIDRYGKYTMNGVGNYDTNLSDNIAGTSLIPNPTPDYFLGFRSAWEVDIWGKLRNRKRAAYTRYLASREGRNLVITTLTASVARLYYTLLALDAEREIIDDNIELQQKAVELVEVQKDAGRVTELAVQQFKAQLLNTRGLKGRVLQEIIATENQLNTLLGRYPQPIDRGVSIEKQHLPKGLSAGIPAQLIRRRPDIRQAERLLEAANIDVAVAQAEFLPSLNLTPYLGLNAFRAGVLLSPQSLATGILGGLAVPVFNRRALNGNLTQMKAQSREAYYAYEKAILIGVAEVVTGLRGLENYRDVASLQREEVTVLQQATSTSKDLFANGYATYLEVITAQRNVLDAQLALITTKQAQFQALVALYQALGGGVQ